MDQLKFSLLSLLPWLIIIVSCSTNNQSKNIRKKFDAYFKAHNDHNIEKELSFLSDDFYLHFTAYDIIINKIDIINVLGWDKGVNGRVSYEKLEIKGDSITGVFIERNDFLKLIGIEELKATIIYTFDRSGMIIRQTYTPFPDQPSVQDKLLPVIEWARTNRSIELNEIYPQNQLQFDLEMAEKWVTLLNDWKNSNTNLW